MPRCWKKSEKAIVSGLHSKHTTFDGETLSTVIQKLQDGNAPGKDLRVGFC